MSETNSPLDINNELDLTIHINHIKSPTGLLSYIKNFTSITEQELDIFLNLEIYIKFKDDIYIVSLGILKDRKTQVVLDDLNKVVAYYERVAGLSPSVFNNLFSNSRFKMVGQSSPPSENSIIDFMLGKIKTSSLTSPKLEFSEVEKTQLKKILSYYIFNKNTPDFLLNDFWTNYRAYQDKSGLEHNLSSPSPSLNPSFVSKL